MTSISFIQFRSRLEEIQDPKIKNHVVKAHPKCILFGGFCHQFEKICSSNWIISPKNWGEHQKDVCSNGPKK